MNTLRIILFSVVLPLGACVGTSDQTSPPAVFATDLARLSDTEWTGSLGYVDYSSGQWSSIPVSIRFDTAEDLEIRFHIEYPDEPQYNESDQLAISSDGRMLNDASIVERRDHGGATVLVTRSRGKDDGRTADIQMTYMLSDRAVRVTKSVRFDDQSEFSRRNTYEIAR